LFRMGLGGLKLMSEYEAHTEVRRGSDRSFGLVFVAVFAIVGLFPLLGDGGVRWWSLAIAVAILAVTLIRPSLLARLNVAWFYVGLLLGRIVSPIVMGILFFGVVLPVGLIVRLRTPDPLRQRFDPDAESYWLTIDPVADSSSMRHQF